MTPRPTITKGDHVEVTRGPHRGVVGEAFAIFARVRNARVMIQDDKGRILSVPMDAANKIGARK